MITRVTWRGTAQVQARIERLMRDFPKAIEQALREEAEIEMAEAKRRTPVKTGTLHSSGLVEGPTRRGSSTTVQLSFGGPAAPYAAAVHENLDAHHPVGQAKFLESVLHESRPHMLARIAKRAREIAGL